MAQVGLDRKNLGENRYSPRNDDSRNSFGSVDSTHSSDARDNGEVEERGRFAMKGLDGPISGGFREVDSRVAQEIDDYDTLSKDPIFSRLCPRELYEDKPTCKVCGKTFNKLKLVAKKHCKFCGGCVCEDHGRKRRPSPQDASEYLRVCDICDEKFINRAILKEFSDKLKKKESEIQDLEKKIRDQQLKIGNEQKEYDDLCLKKSRNDKNYSDQMKFLSDDIARTKEEIKRCEKENGELQKEYNKTQEKIFELDGDIENSEQEYEKLVTEAAKLTNQIEALNQDITQMNREIRNIEEYVNQSKGANGETPRRGGDTSSNTTDGKLGSYRKGAVKGAKKNKGGADSKSGNCDVKCNIF